ncbi:MAG: DNA-directed RNA polymerase subunit alpha [Planctomycetes bacterium]|nr:DNA-directed RNA polymerase subunit alpha [Planctomycetota bacterium]
MRIRWRNFELPSKVVPEKATLTKEYGRFVVEPFEQGFGHTIGNGLRRVLLSSIEGVAVTAVRIDGASHEFDSLSGVYEDVTDIVLNLKRLRIRYEGTEPIVCRVSKKGKGPITGADVQCPGDARVVNPDLHLLTLTGDREFKMELDVSKGRGYIAADEHVAARSQVGAIPIDSIYSPVHRVRYGVEATRVGKFTNYDRLVIEVWTDGTVAPDVALIEAAKIYRKHLNPFVLFDVSRDESPLAEDPTSSPFNERNRESSKVGAMLSQPIADLELSVRARNCLDGANITTLRQLVTMSEQDVMGLKNLGKTSLTEIKSKLAERGLSLGMKVPG